MKGTEHTQLWLPQALQSLNFCCVPCFDQQVAPQLVFFQLLYLAGFHTSSYFFHNSRALGLEITRVKAISLNLLKCWRVASFSGGRAGLQAS